MTVNLSTKTALVMLALVCLLPKATAQDSDFDHFEQQVRPLLAARCYSCHGPEKQFAGLRLDSKAALLKGGKSGPAVVPERPAESLIIRAVRGEIQRMPLGGELAPDEIEALDEWVRAGAPWPADAAPAAEEDRYSKLLREHWAFQSVARPNPPEVSSPAWADHPVDRFIFSALAAKSLTPAPEADRAALIRRLYYVLTGLPPSYEQVVAFESDGAPDAYRRLVDRLLASPRFGEQWARHWLDLVRYAETRGYEWNYEIAGAWRYRDYVVRAFNADVPYDQLIREHIAGDLLAEPRINHDAGLNESVIGTAFYRLGEAGHDDCVKFREIALDVIDNEIDVLSKTFQGLTVACARCHDHKLDPIPTTDYYGLYGILNSSRVAVHTIDTPESRAPILAKLDELKGKIRTELGSAWARDAKRTSRYVMAAAGGADGSDLDPKLLNRWRQAFSRDDLGVDDPAYPWHEIAKQAAAGETSFAAAYSAVADDLKRQEAERRKRNRTDFEPFGDFRRGTPEGWTADGPGTAGAPSSSGEFAVEPSGLRAVRGVYPAGRYTHALSARLNGALRSPLLPAGPRKLSLRVSGGLLGARRVIIDNCAISEDYAFLEGGRPRWITLDVPEKWEKLPAFVELVTRWDNPRIPDRPDRIKEPELALIDSPESYFGVVEAVLHDSDAAPAEELGHLLGLFEAGPAADLEELARRYEAVASKAIARWADGTASDQDVRWLDWLLANDLLTNDVNATSELASLILAYRQAEQRLPDPRVVEGLEDSGAGRDYPVLVYGGPTAYGELAPRRFLSGVLGKQPAVHSGSGRRELAELIASKDNPLTARVMVNRVWSHVFGRGIVASVDNFGTLGEKPSHPELLDFLAARFMERGWSVKDLIRFLVTSSAFRQSGLSTEAARELDPQNSLLHHYPLRRLTAEELRDSLLLAGGELNDEMYGPGVDPYRKSPKEYRRLFKGPLLGDGRRSLYLKVTRMEGSGFLETFDFPPPASTRGARDETNVPAQSLAMMNDPFVTAIAEHCAERLLAGAATSAAERTAALYRMILARSPSNEEQARFESLSARLSKLYDQTETEVSKEQAIWRDLAHVLLNAKEFVHFD